MKKIILLSAMMLMTVVSFGRTRVSEKAVVVADTIYYAADQLCVNNPSQASYYRLLKQQGTGLNKEDVFQDFYMNGTLKAEGGYNFIDLNNDKNTVLNGEVTTYYVNGKESFTASMSTASAMAFHPGRCVTVAWLLLTTETVSRFTTTLW